MIFGNLSLRYKFLLILAFVLVAATVSYLGLAVRLFNTDKKAYIYDNNAALVEALGEEISTGILSALKTMRLAALAPSQDAAKALFFDDDNFVALRVLEWNGAETKESFRAVGEEFLKSYELDPSYIDRLDREFPVSPKQLEQESLTFQNAVLPGGPPLLKVALAVKTAGETGRGTIISAYLRQDRRISVLKRSSLYTTYLVDGTGAILAHGDAARLLRRESLGEVPLVQTVLKALVAKGVNEQEGDQGEAIIVAYRKLGITGLTVISEIPQSVAYVASRRLVERSAMFAILVFSVSFLISIVFSRRLTAALNGLYLATLRIAKGDFDVEVEVKSGDEVGALSRSFNQMAKEIRRLLIETADKARMEKELETAQLVQDNFFPKGDIRCGNLEVSAYFKPASECGGDWWGSFQQEDRLILLIGDATGHGVPAALITAAAHSCAMTLQRLAERLHNLPLTPSFIMDSLNAAIFHAGQGRVKMTFFVAVIDAGTGELQYSNASHELPIICRLGPADDVALDSFDSKPDPCLGESLETVYREYRGVLRPNDAMVLYTDGLLECRSPNDEEFGERRLARQLAKISTDGAAEIKGRLVTAATEFYKKPVQEDDITLVVVKRRNAEQAVKVAS